MIKNWLMKLFLVGSESKCIHIWTTRTKYIRLPKGTYLLNSTNVITSKIDKLEVRINTCKRCNVEELVIEDGGFTFYLKGKKIVEPWWSSIYQNHNKDKLIDTTEFVREIVNDKVIQ